MVKGRGRGAGDDTVVVVLDLLLQFFLCGDRNGNSSVVEGSVREVVLAICVMKMGETKFRETVRRMGLRDFRQERLARDSSGGSRFMFHAWSLST